ncbi:hypothetical protein Q9189_008168 [Teloschistes chrysophthalmus]
MSDLMRLRARRVLHFTEHEVFWECRAASPSFGSETYPHGSPLRRAFLGQTKLRLQDTSTGSLTDNPYLMLAWDDACRDYSQRKLTFQTDKLPALSGLARHFVEPSKLEESYYVADVATIVADYEHKSADQYGELRRASLHVYGFVRRITSIMKMMNDDPDVDAYRGGMQLDDSRSYRHLYVDGELDRDIGHGARNLQQFGEAPDWFHGFDPVEYDCLFLAVSQQGARDDLMLRGLLLESAEKEGTFRRVGHIFFRGRYALEMRYRLRSGVKEEHKAWDQLWELVLPYWGQVEKDVEMGRAARGAPPVNIQTVGPEALYEIDGDVAEDAGFLKLEPQLADLGKLQHYVWAANGHRKYISMRNDLIPITYSGNYGIVGCEEHTDTVVNALNELWTDLQASLKTPNTSTVYNKFFHGVDADRVNTILAHVALGTNITVNGKEFQPTIACATPKIPQVKPYWKFCQNHEVRSLHIKRTEHVILCPAMFQQKTAPENKDCARTRFDGLVSTGQGLARSVMSNLFHVLVQAYLGDHLEPELYGIHALLDLGASESVINPASYVFYVANIKAKCTVFDPPEHLRPPERVLLNDGLPEAQEISEIAQ